ncbi:hypothetical protein ACHZ98_30170 [Streptomyces sp. MAR4 CNY-716]
MRSLHRAAVTPGPGCTSIVEAGVEWDAIKVPRYAGLFALDKLTRPGAVAVDPASAPPVLYFLVPPQSTGGWDVPLTTALSLAAHVVLPSSHREAPPGPYWLIAPGRGRRCTRTADLRRELMRVIQPRAVVPSGSTETRAHEGGSLERAY